MRQRIESLDGLRFLAATGVLWIHSWGKFGHPRCHIGQIDICSILAIGGNGVDLFFVISGFCMYYFYAGETQFSYIDFFNFIAKRWFRLSPAFYTATVAYVLFSVFALRLTVDIPANIITSVLYLNSIFSSYSSAAHFWTLGVEYQFYITIPFLLIYQSRNGFRKVFICLYGSLLIFAISSVLILKSQSDIFTNQIFFRSIEFAFGILSARLVLKNELKIKRKSIWMTIFILTTYCGRGLISKQVLLLSEDYYNLFKLLGFGFMGCGFAGILYLSVTTHGSLAKILGNGLFKTIGKISYSFYLWHMLVIELVAKYIIVFFSFNGTIGAITLTFTSMVILYPISMLSYQFLEKPFLSKRILAIK